MKFGSLFSGIGGFDLGFERAGMTCSWQCEIDKSCQSLLSRKFGVKIYDDVRTITRDAEPVDVICGGFPCQDVSIAGKRAGLVGERSGLWFEFYRILQELKPGWVVIENVPGLLSSNGGKDFATILLGLGNIGYLSTWRILDAQYFGVAQRRRRVFIVGSLGSGRSAEVLFEREGVRWNPPPRGKEGKGTSGFSPTGFGKYSEEFGTLRANGGYLGGGSETIIGFDLAQITSKLNYSNPKSGDPQPPINTFAQGMVAYENHPADSRITETGDISQQLTSRMGTGGGNVPLVANTVGALQSRDCKGIGTTIDDKMVATSRTLRSGKEGGGKGYLGAEEKAMTLGGQQQFVGVRRLTPTECERLQGFPDGWTDGQSDSTRYKQLGNAVAVPAAEWIGKRINR